MPSGYRYRTDRHNNPTAATYSLFKQAEKLSTVQETSLREGVHFVKGEPFRSGKRKLHTARILEDPITVSIKLIDTVGFYTRRGAKRWDHTAIPWFVWHSMNEWQKTLTILEMYKREGGEAMLPLFQQRLKLLNSLEVSRQSHTDWVKGLGAAS